MTTLSHARVAGWASRWLTDELSVLARVGNWEGAIDALQQVEVSNVVAQNVFHYTTIINACARAGHVDAAFSVFSHMKAKHVRPNVYTYTALINACCNARRADAALRVFAEMRLREEPPNVKTMTALVSACARVGRWEKAIQVLRECEELGIAPNVRTYTAAMDGCRRAGLCQPAVRLLAFMRDPHGARPNEITYNTLLGACATAKDIPAAQRVYAKMAADGYAPLAYTRTLLGTLFRGSALEGLADDLRIYVKPGRHEVHIPDTDPVTAMKAAQPAEPGEAAVGGEEGLLVPPASQDGGQSCV